MNTKNQQVNIRYLSRRELIEMAGLFAVASLSGPTLFLSACGNNKVGVSTAPTTSTTTTANTLTGVATTEVTTLKSTNTISNPSTSATITGPTTSTTTSGPTASTTTFLTTPYTQNGGTDTKPNLGITVSANDTSAVTVTGSGNLTLSDSTVNTSGNTSSMDNSSFYGQNAAVLAESCSKIKLTNCVITTSGTGANGVFATGTGSSVDLSGVKIHCTASGAHGVDATQAGTLTLTNVDITTAGNGAAAAIATDRGGGMITVSGGTVATTGSKSPGVYSTGNITITGANISATGSEAAVIEGKNSITLNDTTISGKVSWGVLVYQSMSGDASVGTGNFTMTGGSLNAATGPIFYSTNTQSVFSLKNVTLTGSSGVLLKASADQWGTSESNGADVTFTADTQSLSGDITCDKISTIKATLKNASSLTGTINKDNSARSVTLALDKTSSWSVRGTSYLTSLTDDDTSLTNIKDNGNTIYYNTKDSGSTWLGGKTVTLAGGGKLTPTAGTT